MRLDFFIIYMNSHYFMHKWLIPSANQGHIRQLNQNLLISGEEVESAAFSLISYAFGSKSILQKTEKIKKVTKDKIMLAVFSSFSPGISVVVKTEKWANWIFALT